MIRTLARRLAVAGIALVLFLLTSREARATDLSGAWSGYWVDGNSGHSGPLRATFCQCADGRYRAVFTGRFWKVIPFRYSVVLDVTAQDGDKLILSGESHLGLLFGTFTYDARADATDFVADYSSRRYHGQFVLRRSCR